MYVYFRLTTARSRVIITANYLTISCTPTAGAAEIFQAQLGCSLNSPCTQYAGAAFPVSSSYSKNFSASLKFRAFDSTPSY